MEPIWQADFLETVFPFRFDILLANPPFGAVQRERKRGASGEVAYIQAALHALSTDGRGAFVAPVSLLWRNTQAHVGLRKALVQQHALQAVIHLPVDSFAPTAAVSTVLCIFGGAAKDEIDYYASPGNYVAKAGWRGSIASLDSNFMLDVKPPAAVDDDEQESPEAILDALEADMLFMQTTLRNLRYLLDHPEEIDKFVNSD